MFQFIRPYLASIILTQNVTTPEVRTGEKANIKQDPYHLTQYILLLSPFHGSNKIDPLFCQHLYINGVRKVCFLSVIKPLKHTTNDNSSQDPPCCPWLDVASLPTDCNLTNSQHECIDNVRCFLGFPKL